MRIYEELFIVRPDATEQEIDALNGQLESLIQESGGAVEKVDKWGVKKLAYRVQKRAEGFYILIKFHAQPDLVKELERRLRVTDLVMKHLTVRMDEKLKWLEKRQKARAARAARKPAPPSPPPGAPAPAQPAQPAAQPVESSPAPGAPPVVVEG